MSDEMKKVVKCECGRDEYFGMMHWLDGRRHCRICIELIWVKEGAWPVSMNAFNHYFPKYADGIDYRKGVETK